MKMEDENMTQTKWETQEMLPKTRLNLDPNRHIEMQNTESKPHRKKENDVNKHKQKQQKAMEKQSRYEIKEVIGKSESMIWQSRKSMRNIANPTSDFGALLHIVKASLGSGLLAMPYAFKQAGLIGGLVGSLIIGILITHCTYLLLNCSEKLFVHFENPALTYAETAEFAFVYGSDGKYKKYAPRARKTVHFFLFLTYYGVNTIYVLLVASTLHEIVNPIIEYDINIRVYTLSLIVLVLPIGMIRSIKFLVPCSAIANGCLVVALVLIFHHLVVDLPPLTSRPSFVSISKFPLFLGTSLLGMEGIGTILPVENDMKNPERLLKCPGLLYMGMILVVVLNAVIGFLGYVKFGDDVLGTVSLNFPNDWLSEGVKMLVGIAILFTYGLQMTVSAEVTWDYLKDNVSPEKECFIYYVARATLVAGTVVIATAFPNIGPVIGLIGSIGFSMLGLFCPAAIDTIFRSSNGFGILNWHLWKNVILMFIAVFALVTGSYASIIDALGE